MPSKKFDVKAFAEQFEILIDGVGAAVSGGETVHVNIEKGSCGANYGQPCSDASNRPCDQRGKGVHHCDEDGVWTCDKVNNQGCHGAGRYCVNRR